MGEGDLTGYGRIRKLESRASTLESWYLALGTWYLVGPKLNGKPQASSGTRGSPRGQLPPLEPTGKTGTLQEPAQTKRFEGPKELRKETLKKERKETL